IFDKLVNKIIFNYYY
ncbi:unnamed protein product, partial [Rotaria socialis]